MSAPARRGRPPEADRAQICAVALKLFEQHGFDAVTMNEIADEAKVSRRTLFRVFPSKADLVWEGLLDVMTAVQGRAANVGERKISLDAMVDSVFVPILEQFDTDPAAAKLARRRLRLIAASPGLLNHPALGLLQQATTVALEKYTVGLDESPELVARTIVAVGFAAVLWWAEHPAQGGIVSALRRSLSVISRANGRAR